MDEDQYCCHRCYCERCGSKHVNGFCSKCNLYVNPNSFNNYDPRMSFLDNPSNDIRDQKALDTMQTWCESIIQKKVKEKQEEKNIAEKAADHRTHTPEFLDSLKLTYKKSTIPLNNTPHSPDFSEFPPQPQYVTYSCELCGNDAHFGYDCPTQVPFIFNPDPCYNQNFDNNFPQTSPSLPQYLCCTRCGGPHETFQCDQLTFDEPYCENCGGPHMSFQCQPMNQNFYNSNSSGFDQFQPLQYPVSSQPPEESIKEFFVKHAQEMITTVQSAVKIVIQQHEQAVQKEQEEQAAFTPY
ncbi:hypothetical protein Tco_0490807 [Tanacetum coccineum]